MGLLQLCTCAVTPHGCGFQSALPCLAVADIFAVNHFAAVREHAETAAMVVEAQLICEQGVQGGDAIVCTLEAWQERQNQKHALGHNSPAGEGWRKCLSVSASRHDSASPCKIAAAAGTMLVPCARTVSLPTAAAPCCAAGLLLCVDRSLCVLNRAWPLYELYLYLYYAQQANYHLALPGKTQLQISCLSCLHPDRCTATRVNN